MIKATVTSNPKCPTTKMILEAGKTSELLSGRISSKLAEIVNRPNVEYTANKT
jgi:hypothetical protein